MTVFDEGQAPRGGVSSAGLMVNYAGAAVSLALMAGIGVWGYQLIVRDVTGIPVVRAMAGEMRVSPSNPGGDVALHAGLSVNGLIAEGGAAAPEDRLVLAPPTANLADEDLQAQPLAEVGEVRAVDPAPAPEVAVALNVVEVPEASSEPLTAEQVLALADQIAASTTPLTALAEGTTVAAEMSLDGVQVAAFVPPASATRAAVSVSPRPSLRPARQIVTPQAVDTSAVAAAVAAVATPETLVSAAVIPTGTKLVQLGAFPTAQGAAAAWIRLDGQFSDFMQGKERLIQSASSGGRTFYRLRAMSFADLGDARRFCASLAAENADCIPVVVR